MTRVVWHKKNDLDTSVQATQNISNEHRLGKCFERIFQSNGVHTTRILTETKA